MSDYYIVVHNTVEIAFVILDIVAVHIDVEIFLVHIVVDLVAVVG